MKPTVYLLLILPLLALGTESADTQWPRVEDGPRVPHRSSFSATALSNEQILIVGGSVYSRTSPDWLPTMTAEVYDIAAQRFAKVGSTHYYYYEPDLLTLPDGRILVAGLHHGVPGGGQFFDTYFPEIYDPDTKEWTLLEKVELDASERVHANSLYDGTVLFLAVNHDRVFDSTRRDARMYRAWLYDSERDIVEEFTPLLSPRTGALPIILPSGDVLITGGSAAIFEPEHLCEQVPPEYAIEAGEPSGDWCASHGKWINVAATTTEHWDIFWNELSVYEQLPFAGANDVFTQLLSNGDVLATTRIDPRLRTQIPRSAAVWSIQTEQWTRIDDFPEYFHLDINNDLLELDNGALLGPSGAYSSATGEWHPFPDSLWTGPIVELPSGVIGFIRSSEPYWTELDPASADWVRAAD